MAAVGDVDMSNDMHIDKKSEMNSFLLSKFPIRPDECSELHMSDDDFKCFIQSIPSPPSPASSKGFESNVQNKPTQTEPASRFIQGLSEKFSSVRTKAFPATTNTILTENGDVAFISSGDALVDFFYKFDNIDDPKALKELLDQAWNVDAHHTLKLIFQLRSIHVGKGEKISFYKAMAWLYEWHPKTFLMNLPWVVRPVIEKKKSLEAQAKEKKEKEDEFGVITMDEDEEFEMVNAATSYSTFDLDEPHGHSHGYWKDLLNMLVLAVEGKFNLRTSESTLTTPKQKSFQREWDFEKAKTRHQSAQDQRFKMHEESMADSKYRAFHTAVARLFATQLAADLSLLKNGKEGEVSLAAKWAPSPKEFHDRHTFIVASIAEIMFSHETICPDVPKDDRITYLKMARMAYRFQVLSPLRKALDVVERHLTAKTYSDIKYEKVPSKAMSKYTYLFRRNDFDNFRQYLNDVDEGKSKISGAILLPAQLVNRGLQLDKSWIYGHSWGNDEPRNGMIESNDTKDESKMLNAQWNTIVERIKRSGKLTSSIAVCDVSGSMKSPHQKDGTNPMESAIGLSLLLSEVTEAPFGGHLITFSDDPSFIKVGGPNDKRSFVEKVGDISRASWMGSTDFVAVFERLILPMAMSNKLKQEEMVKQVFVFSDMQFNEAEVWEKGNRWANSYERIKKRFEQAGYQMPHMIFWNLAGREGGVPVVSNEPGTALISGYSQAQMKIFLDEGGFEDEPIQLDTGNAMKDDGEQVMKSLATVKKATSHKAFAMLKVYD